MQPNGSAVDNTRVFVVHGRNEELRKSMFDFLRSIGLKPIEWTQAIQMTGETSPFIGEILDAAFQQAQAVVVLLNGDDEARLRPEYYSDKMPEYEKNPTPQARPNVIFEAGLALGRFPKRTIIVEIGNLRPFSDIAGRHTIRLNDSTKTRQDVAQRLTLAGCKVDLSGTDWHTVGDFEQKNEKAISNEQINVHQQETPKSEENQLHPELINAMKAFMESADFDGDTTVSKLARVLKVSEGKSKYLLEKLFAEGLVVHNGTYFRMTTKGLDELFGKGLL